MSECKCDYSDPNWASLVPRPQICAFPSYESDGVCRNCFHDIECHSRDDLLAMIEALACDVKSATEKSPSFKAVPLSSLKMLLRLQPNPCPACDGEGFQIVIDPDERMPVKETCGKCGGAGVAK